ncbi:Cof-type HAD-IIB family hydrolase [Sporosarcina sp. E16_8]|uniref:Cof-type HAD-IIB family hydrolase n=1 Tax=Sporosarcina sp. E16_8 TaxID=2789295 RepID=UPI001A90F1DE|nr:Cof-type HAD-IIB family hydrolase [Sporosarcina sp. E16_8]MBO0587474.1 HAD family phosphatase [Sporosarcina sp. E16_8]
MVNYRLLVLDLDGTVLTRDGQITDESKLWISRAIAAGVVVILATGRGLHQEIEAFREALDLDTPMVLANGGEIWEGTGKILERYYISKEDIRMLHSISIEAKAEFGGYSVEKGPDEKDIWTDEMFDFDWITFSIRHENPNALDHLKKHVENSATLEVISSASANMDFSLKGISKESGVRRVCEYLNIEMESVMAIGDNLNDFKLIQSAGLGIAMGNADDKLKQVADQVTASNEEDGVAKAIKRYLFEEKDAV